MAIIIATHSAKTLVPAAVNPPLRATTRWHSGAAFVTAKLRANPFPHKYEKRNKT